MKTKASAVRARLPGAVVMLGVVSFFTDVGSEMIYPLIPVFVSLMGSGVVVLGVIEGAAEATASLLKLASGFPGRRRAGLRRDGAADRPGARKGARGERPGARPRLMRRPAFRYP